MAVIVYSDRVEILKFKSTGALPLFDEVINFVAEEFTKFGRRWEVVNLYSNATEFRVVLEEI